MPQGQGQIETTERIRMQTKLLTLNRSISSIMSASKDSIPECNKMDPSQFAVQCIDRRMDDLTWILTHKISKGGYSK